MKLVDYMEKNRTENLSWCRPYVDESGEYALILHDGEVDCLRTPYGVYYTYGNGISDEVMKDFAKDINPHYDCYDGWSDLHIALEMMHEVGCYYCPFKGECEAMRDEIEEMEEND